MSHCRLTVREIGGGRGIRTPKGLAARWISSPLPYQLRLALRGHSRSALTIHEPHLHGSPIKDAPPLTTNRRPGSAKEAWFRKKSRQWVILGKQDASRHRGKKTY